MLPPSFWFLSFVTSIVPFLVPASILVQEEYGPILVPDMCLIWQHQLRKHMLVPTDGTWILVFHDGASVYVK